MNLKTIIICITGDSGSGKTTFAKELISALPKDKINLISQDSYYKDLKHLTIQERSSQNFDHPNALDLDLLKKHLITLKNGEEIIYKDLAIKVMKCTNSELDDNPEITAYIQAKDLTSKDNDDVFIFNGWTFASDPSLTPFDHAIYDLQLLNCKKA